MVKVTLPNGTVTTLEYDDLGRLTALVNAKGEGPGDAVITSYAYRYDDDAIHSGLGLVDRITHEDGRFDTFSYDAHERLTTEHYKTPQNATLFRFDYTYDDDGNRLSKKHDNDATKVVWFSDETDRTTIDTDFGPSNQLARMWTQGNNTTGTKHTVCGSFTEENIDSIEVVSKTTGDTEVDSVTAQIRDGLFIARALSFFDGENLATKATATATDLADNTVSTTNTGIDLDTTLDVWYTYDAAGRREYKYEAGEYSSGEPYTRYYWSDAGMLEQVDLDYGTGESPRYARAWLTWDAAGDLVKLEIRVCNTSLGDLSEGSGGTLVFLTKYTYFGGAVIVERDEVPGTPEEKEYVSAGGAYLYQVDASDDYWYYHYDGDGSVAAITGASGTISALYEYDAFGNKLTNAGTVDNAFGFYGGTLLDRIGLIHHGRGHLSDPEAGARVSRAPRDGGNAPYAALLVSALTGIVLSRRATGWKRAVVACLSVTLVAGALCLGCRKRAPEPRDPIDIVFLGDRYGLFEVDESCEGHDDLLAAVRYMPEDVFELRDCPAPGQRVKADAVYAWLLVSNPGGWDRTIPYIQKIPALWVCTLSCWCEESSGKWYSSLSCGSNVEGRMGEQRQEIGLESWIGYLETGRMSPNSNGHELPPRWPLHPGLGW